VHLDGNEGPLAPPSFVEALDGPSAERIRNYPDTIPLIEAIADRHGVTPDHVVVTAGADEAILRIARIALEPGRNMVVPEPTFALVPRFGALTGAEIRRVGWHDGPYPAAEVAERADTDTGLVVAITPNNPTGLVAARERIESLLADLPDTLLFIDHAYVEFCDEDLTDLAVDHDNVVVARTLSKAFGMAGLRVGYTIANPRITEWLDSVGNPYPISSTSVQVASARLEGDRADIDRYVDRVRLERDRLEAVLADYGVEVSDSRANFVFGRFEGAAWIQDALAGMGVAVRAFPGDTELADALRITCPGDEETADRLVDALHTIFDPGALFLDMDGVLADVSESYRQAIVQTAAYFGLELTDEDVSRAKSAGDANNDWVLIERLLDDAGIDADYEDIKAVYEARYQGEGEHRGLWREESLIHSIDRLRKLAERIPLGIVTGRPRRDAERFFDHTGLDEVVEAVVCMEDAPRKPSPEPVDLLADRMGVERGWMVGDTPDDARAARAHGALPLGVIGPGENPTAMRPALIGAGCARIIEDFDELETLLTIVGNRHAPMSH